MSSNAPSQTITTLPTVLQQLINSTVLCIGDIMLDRYVYGEVSRISPEAPVPVLKVQKESNALGGVGNVARNLTAIGCRAQLISVIGEDDTATQLKDLLLQSQVSAHLLVDDGPTPLKVRHIAGRQQVLRADNESTHAIDGKLKQELITKVTQLLPQCGAMILSDYGKGTLPASLCHTLIELAQRNGVPVLVDPKSTDYAKYYGATYITPNKQELSAASNMPVETDIEVATAARKLIANHKITGIIATRSEKGMSVVLAGEVTHVPTEAQEVFDVSGAGDTVIATLAAALASKASLKQAAMLANVAAGVVVGKLGTAVASPPEIRQAMRRHQVRFRQQTKIMELSAAHEQIAHWRELGYKVGFTNGCFDILHAGHVTYLAEARGQCDRLVLGLNTDASIKRLKGESRPINDTESRASVLAGLESVDLIIPFAEDTPIGLITSILPEVLIKGEDYTVEQIAGSKEVIANGGRVHLAKLVPDHSTSSIIQRIEAA